SGADPPARSTAGPSRESQLLAILFVDPNTEAAERLSTLLPAHWQVTIVPTAQDALVAMRQRPPHVVITEIDLPDQSGLELITAIRDSLATHNVVLIVVTDRASVRDKVLAFQADVDDYLVKPVDPEQFAMHIALVSRFRAVVANK